MVDTSVKVDILETMKMLPMSATRECRIVWMLPGTASTMLPSAIEDAMIETRLLAALRVRGPRGRESYATDALDASTLASTPARYRQKRVITHI